VKRWRAETRFPKLQISAGPSTTDTVPSNSHTAEASPSGTVVKPTWKATSRAPAASPTKLTKLSALHIPMAVESCPGDRMCGCWVGQCVASFAHVTPNAVTTLKHTNTWQPVFTGHALYWSPRVMRSPEQGSLKSLEPSSKTRLNHSRRLAVKRGTRDALRSAHKDPSRAEVVPLVNRKHNNVYIRFLSTGSTLPLDGPLCRSRRGFARTPIVACAASDSSHVDSPARTRCGISSVGVAVARFAGW